jgi:hypothetical protein
MSPTRPASRLNNAERLAQAIDVRAQAAPHDDPQERRPEHRPEENQGELKAAQPEEQHRRLPRATSRTAYRSACDSRRSINSADIIAVRFRANAATPPHRAGYRSGEYRHRRDEVGDG